MKRKFEGVSCRGLSKVTLDEIQYNPQQTWRIENVWSLHNFRTTEDFSSYNLLSRRESWLSHFEKMKIVVGARKKNIPVDALIVSDVTKTAVKGNCMMCEGREEDRSLAWSRLLFVVLMREPIDCRIHLPKGTRWLTQELGTGNWLYMYSPTDSWDKTSSCSVT